MPFSHARETKRCWHNVTKVSLHYSLFFIFGTSIICVNGGHTLRQKNAHRVSLRRAGCHGDKTTERGPRLGLLDAGEGPHGKYLAYGSIISRSHKLAPISGNQTRANECCLLNGNERDTTILCFHDKSDCFLVKRIREKMYKRSIRPRQINRRVRRS